MNTVHFSKITTNLGDMYLASSSEGLCRISLPGERQEEFFCWLSNHFSHIEESVEKKPSRCKATVRILFRKIKGLQCTSSYVWNTVPKKGLVCPG